MKLVCNVNIVYRNQKHVNFQDYAQKPQRNCTFMNLASGEVVKHPKIINLRLLVVQFYHSCSNNRVNQHIKFALLLSYAAPSYFTNAASCELRRTLKSFNLRSALNMSSLRLYAPICCPSFPDRLASTVIRLAQGADSYPPFL